MAFRKSLHFEKMIVHETMEKIKRTIKTNLTIRPAWIIIWTTSLPNAVSREITPGREIIGEIVIKFIIVAFLYVQGNVKVDSN